MAAKKMLAEIKQDLDACVGKKIRLRASRGRKKVMERVGILEQTYPHIFIVKVDGVASPARRLSFSYTDILTDTVELTIFPEEAELKVEGRQG